MGYFFLEFVGLHGFELGKILGQRVGWDTIMMVKKHDQSRRKMTDGVYSSEKKGVVHGRADDLFLIGVSSLSAVPPKKHANASRKK